MSRLNILGAFVIARGLINRVKANHATTLTYNWLGIVVAVVLASLA